MLDEFSAKKLAIDFMHEMCAWEVNFYKERKAIWDVDGNDSEINNKAKKILTDIFERFVIKDKVNYSRLDAMSCQLPPEYDFLRDGIDDFSVDDKCAHITFTQKEGLQVTIKIEIDLVAEKIKKAEDLSYKGKWRRRGL